MASILQKHGYQRKGKRWLSPQSESGIPGVVIITGQDGRERAYSHGTSDVLCDGKAHDAFGLFCLLDHGGDEWAAIQHAATLLTTGNGGSIMHHNRDQYRKQAAISRAAELQSRLQWRVAQ